MIAALLFLVRAASISKRDASAPGGGALHTRTGNAVATAARRHPARLYVLDLLAIDGRDVRALTLLERKRLLREVFADSIVLVFMNGICGHGRAAFEQVVSMDLEGLVAKRPTPSSRGGRTHDWLKIINHAYHRRSQVLRGWHTGDER